MLFVQVFPSRVFGTSKLRVEKSKMVSVIAISGTKTEVFFYSSEKPVCVMSSCYFREFT